MLELGQLVHGGANDSHLFVGLDPTHLLQDLKTLQLAPGVVFLRFRICCFSFAFKSRVARGWKRSLLVIITIIVKIDWFVAVFILLFWFDGGT